jgi:hypothetical protein
MPLSEEAAITRGIEMFLEIGLIYFLLTVLTLHEMKKAAEKSA